MTRSLGYLSLALALACGVAARVVAALGYETVLVGGIPLELAVVSALNAVAILLGTYGVYRVLLAFLADRTESKRRMHDVRNVLRLAFGVVAAVGVFGALTQRWVGLLFSLGIVGFGITFALQQPLFSLIGWVYIMVKRPYRVGDRVAIDDSKGDVVEIDFLVTTLWEIDGELVSSNQPSGRIITLPNSVVLSSHVFNYSWEEFPYVWNELTVQVAYETDLEFATEAMVEEASAVVGDEMSNRIARYRERLAETPVELEVRDRPTVNVVQQESWVELRCRYLVHPKRGARTKNELYRRILSRFNDEPERVKFPIGRSR